MTASLDLAAAPLPPTTGAPVVEVTGLTHRYGDRVALNDLSLSVNQGEIFGFLGPNGSGKTTLFRILCTLVAAPPGAARMFGLDLAEHRDEIRKKIGVVFQSPSLDKQLTAEENLRCHGHLCGLGGKALAARIDELLARVGLAERRHEYVGTFSGGMRRRVELAKGLLNRPSVLLLDEPSTGLDPGARIDLWTYLKEIQAGGQITVLMTTHLMDEADRCSRLAILDRGVLAACDTPAAMKERIGGDVVSLTTASPVEVVTALSERLGIAAETVNGVVRFERRRGHEVVPAVIEALPGLIDAVSVGKPTLEDVFIRVTGRGFVDEATQPVAKADRR